MNAKDAGPDERVTFKLTTGQEILIGRRLSGPVDENRRTIERLRKRGKVILEADLHPASCDCDECVPF